MVIYDAKKNAYELWGRGGSKNSEEREDEEIDFERNGKGAVDVPGS